ARVVEQRVSAAEPTPAGVGVVVSGAALDGRRERALTLLRDDVDDAADRVGAVERRLRPTDDLDAVDQVGRDVGEVGLPRRRALDPDAVDEDLNLVGVGAADADVGNLADAARAADLDAGHGAKEIFHGLEVVLLHVVAGHDGPRGAPLL